VAFFVGSIAQAIGVGIADAVAAVPTADHAEQRRGYKQSEGEAFDEHGFLRDWDAIDAHW